MTRYASFKLRWRLNDFLSERTQQAISLSRRTSSGALFIGMRECNGEPDHGRSAIRRRSEIDFEYVPGPFEITPELAKVLLRILRKAAERRGIDIDDTVSPPS